ncbi:MULTISPECIES: HlyD family secretion protein [unclassified Alteromonas]|uniref:HlyD family secretion protein n=1 Tax=unclassified Alteromonas TaxID=2614992 RepID=UPI0005097017|nr:MULTISPECIES: efflux RND transporter periplasmic adaptor subunit [unclassified Alteromonas]
MQAHIKTKQSLQKPYLILVFFVFLLIAVFIVSFYQSSKSQTRFETYEVRLSPSSSLLRGIGKIVSTNTQVVAANEDGYVSDIYVHQGQRVKKGDKLFSLTNPLLTREYREIESQALETRANVAFRISQLKMEEYKLQSDVSAADSMLKKQQLEYDANRTLHEAGIVSNIRYKQQELTLAQARLSLASARKQLEMFTENKAEQVSALNLQNDAASEKVAYFKERINELTVKAAISGLVKDLKLSSGQAVNIGQSLASIVDDASLVAEVRIPQYLSHKISLNSVAEVISPAGRLEGKVAFIDSIVREGAVQVTIDFKTKTNEQFTVEQSIEAEITSSDVEMVASVSKPPNYNEQKEWTVFKIFDGEMVATDVRVSHASSDSLFLSGNLKEGENIALVQNSSGIEN